MNPVDQFLSRVTNLGVRLWADGDRLRYRAPKGAMTPELIAELRDLKLQILARLSDSRTAAIPRIPDQNHYALSHAQRRLWVLTQLESGSAAWHVPLGLLLNGDLDPGICENALEKLVQRHESLRTTIIRVDGEPMQRIHEQMNVPLKFVDLSHEADASTAARRMAVDDAMQPFDLEHGPLLRATLVRLEERRYALLLVLHHIVTDGWSNNVIAREFTEFYRAEWQQRAVRLPELKFHYRDFAAWQNAVLNGAEADIHRDYWLRKLAGDIVPLDLPTDFPRPAVRSNAGATVAFSLSSELTAALRDYSSRRHASLFMTLLAVLKVLLFRYSGQRDVIVGTPFAGQPRLDADDQIGCYLNMLPLRDVIDPHASFDDLLDQIRQTATDAYAHDVYPFDRLIEELDLPRDVSRSPLMDVMLILQKVDREESGTDGLAVEPYFVDLETTLLDLVIDVEERGGQLHFAVGYSTALFTEQRMQRFGVHFESIVRGILADATMPVEQLRVSDENERTTVLRSFNETKTEFPAAHTVIDLFQRQVAQSPDDIAVEFGDETISYRELDHRSDLLARHLRTLGVGPEKLVGLCMERSTGMVSAVLGILKSGAAYVPLDPDFPPQRLEWIIEDASPGVLVTSEAVHGRLPRHSAHVVIPERDVRAPAAESDEPVEIETKPQSRAYVIYTSGSTGRPKGVDIPHGALVNFLQSMQIRPGIESTDRLLAVTTLSFDIAALEILLPLISGARVVMATRTVAADGFQLARLIEASGTTIMQATPATWRLLLEAGWTGASNLKILCGGEALPSQLSDELRQRGHSVWNLYGPTETTIWSTLREVSHASPDSLRQNVESIGNPIANTSVYILDGRFEPMPLGVPGDLYIGGAGLARGYYQRASLTAERFLPDPFSNEAGARIYRTGDVARYRPDGNIEFLGRSDNQVKVRGYRIEVGEIENLMGTFSGVRQCCVADHTGSDGETELTGCYTIEPGHDVSVDELRRHLRQQLPEYMVPRTLTQLERLPLTPNGKVDRRALPRPDAVQVAESHQSVPARNAREQQIADLWSEILGVPSVGVTDDFFSLGGHSIRATRLAARLQQELQVDVELAEIFRHPTVAELAELIEARQRSTATAPDSADAGSTIAPMTAEEMELLHE